MMAPLLARWGGSPLALAVEDGALTTGCAFRFALLASDGAVNAGQPWLEERQWVFSLAPSHHLQLAAALGVLNFLGVRWLGTQAALLLAAPAATGGGALGNAILSTAFGVLGVLRLYALAFLSVPALRWLALHALNEVRGKRNRRRMELAVALDRARMSEDSWLSRRANVAARAAAGLGV